MNNETWLWCPDKLRSGNVIQLALETNGGVEVGILWGINGSLDTSSNTVGVKVNFESVTEGGSVGGRVTLLRTYPRICKP